MQIILVDENDREIDAAEYEKAKFSGIYRVSALWLTNEHDEVLLAQRKMDKLTDPGKWGPAAAGTVEVGESYEENIYKEAAEEIGLTGITFTPGPKVFNDSNTDRKFFVQWFTAKIDWLVEKFKLQESEVEQIAWVNKGKLIRQLQEKPENFVAGARHVWTDFL